jgi:hypothetical protein
VLVDGRIGYGWTEKDARRAAESIELCEVCGAELGEDGTCPCCTLGDLIDEAWVA